MEPSTKGKSPFYPGQPIPVEYFIGRRLEIEKIERTLKQVELGKPQAVFLVGDYGIGKSSLAGYMRSYAEKQNHLFGIHVFLGGASTVDDVAMKTVEAALTAQSYTPTISEKIRDVLSKYIGKQELFGVQLNFDALKADSPNLSRGFLPFLDEILKRLEESGIKGLMLIFDEINGIAKAPAFAHFIKGLIDTNALRESPLPLMLMLCGVEKRRDEMIQSHKPVERIFEIVEVNPMNDNETRIFFTNSFNLQNIKVEEKALVILSRYSAGYPKIMHILGDETFWIDKDGLIDEKDALTGVVAAAEIIGRNFIDQQVVRALRSKDYHSILKKMGKLSLDLSFTKTALEKGLTESEKRKLNNFLQRMKKLNALSTGEVKGQYSFNSIIERLYFYLSSIEDVQSRHAR